MNIVIYTRDLEPITVIDLPMWAIEQGARQRLIYVDLVDPIPLGPALPTATLPPLERRVVALEFMPIQLSKHRSHIIITGDEELALQLRPSWLPGQRRRINAYERQTLELSQVLLQTLARGLGGH